MPKVPLKTITSGYGTVDALNQNFDAIEAAFDNTLSRDGDTPNQMQANLDMNGYEVLNVGSLNGVPVADLSDISGYVDTALAAATSASASATNAANTYDLFDDRYLGSKTSNPTVDNDGNALQVGAEYWNSVSNERRTWTGSAWVSSITVVPDASVTTAKLADGAVATAKLANDSVTTAKLADDSVTTAKLADGSVTTAKWAAANGQLAGFRNKIINGKMEIAQRGTSFPAIGFNLYSLDRWKHTYNTTAVTTVTQQADVPNSNEFQSSLRVTVTTADTSISASDYYTVTHLIEGFNVRDLIGRTFTLSFWVRSSKTGTHCIGFNNFDGFDADRSYVAQYTVNAVNTWEFKTVSVSGGLITAGTWNWTNGIGLQVRFVLAAGSAFQTTANAWQTSNPFATANQVNCLDTIGNIFAITGVQLEPGSVATPFEHRPIGVELALCQKYFERIATCTGTLNNTGAVATVSHTTAYQVRKRVTPTLAVGLGAAQFNTVDGCTTFQGSIAAGAYYSPLSISADAEL